MNNYLYAYVVGNEKHNIFCDHYINTFEKLSRADFVVGFNWAGLLFGSYAFFYRKLYAFGVLLALFPFFMLLFIPLRLVYVSIILQHLICAFCIDRLLFARYEKMQVEAVRLCHNKPRLQEDFMRAQGGTNKSLVLGLAVLHVLAVFVCYTVVSKALGALQDITGLPAGEAIEIIIYACKNPKEFFISVLEAWFEEAGN